MGRAIDRESGHEGILDAAAEGPLHRTDNR